MDYDVVIIGSGISGLHAAVNILKKYPKLRVAVYEKYKFLGGRAFTFHGMADGHPVQWEEGAGRISTQHTLVLSLIKNYGLTFAPIGSKVLYKSTYTSPLEPDTFEPAIPIMIHTLASLPPEELANSTIKKLLIKIHGAAATEKYLTRFPYRAEVDTLRADLALDVFRGEMGSHEGYGICAEGLSKLIECMRADFVKRGGTVFPHHEAVEVSDHRVVFRVGPPSDGPSREEKAVTASIIVCALPSAAINRIKGLHTLPVLKYLQMKPLLRFYAVFPITKPMWYEKVGLTVTDTTVRYMIPGNPAQGTCQISYTDSQDAQPLMKMIDDRGENKTGEFILKELRGLFDPKIPTPVLYKAHSWKEGTTYWLPGSYNPYTESAKSIHPMPDTMPSLYLCGESFSIRQAWMEGALEQTEKMLHVLQKKLSHL